MLRIGLIGTGTVGGGVIQILEQKIAEYKEKLGVELELSCICAKSEEEVAPYKAKGYKVSTNADEMIAGNDIDVLVELAGGYNMPRKWILAACFVLTLCMILSCVPQVMGFVRGGFRVDTSLQPLIVCLLVSLLLILRVCYHHAASVVITAVEYELRLGYKETGMERVRLGWFAFLQGLLLLAAAAALFVYAGAEVRYSAAFVLPAVKFFAVWKAWRVFRRCHR